VTSRAWIESRLHAVPASLASRVRRETSRMGREADAQSVPEATRNMALSLLRDALATGGQTRATVMDLLAADAFITWSCEAACQSPRSIDSATVDAMRSVVALHAAIKVGSS
jgi:hypothetical protein